MPKAKLSINNIDFAGKTKLWFTLSLIVIGIGIAAMLGNGMMRGQFLNFGIDFSGGTILSLRFTKTVQTQDIRQVLAKFDLAQAEIQKTGAQDFSIRSAPLVNEKRVAIIAALDKGLGGAELLEADTIGPLIGKELRRQALWAFLVATILIVVYISLRFEFKYALAAIFALYHDALITLGLVALLWRPIGVPFVAAILTILGYSVNDTIIIFDRIRENVTKKVKGNFAQVVNKSINQTLTRSINTVLTVLFMNVAILLFGGTTIKDFALVLLIGFTTGAYSSIFIAGPLVSLWTKKK